MSKETYLIQEQTLTDVADAIRDKDGTEEPIQVSNYATRIRSIPSGTGVLGDGIKVYMGSGQNIIKNTFTKINLDTVDYNSSTCFTNSNNAVYIGKGVSLVLVICRWTAWEQGNYNKYIYIYKNDSQVTFLSAMYDATLETLAIVPVQEYDYLDLRAYQESNGTLSISSTKTQTYMEVIAIK